MFKLLIEGWRFIPQSYALVNQYQCIELMTRKNVNLHHTDVPYYSQWNAHRGILPLTYEIRLAALREAPQDAAHDAVLRIFAPYLLSPSRATRTYVFMTCEMGVIPPRGLQGNAALGDAMKNSDVTLVTPSSWSARGLVHAGADESRIRIVPHGVDQALYNAPDPARRQVLRKRLGYEGEFIFLHIGAMTKNKGISLLLRSFAAVARRYPQSRLILKGLDELYQSSNLLQSVTQEFSALEMQIIEPRLRYIGGNATVQEMVEMFQAADAYVSPYLGEGFNIPALEAIACGLPVICTRGGSTDDFITPETALRIDSEIQTSTTPWGQEKYFLMPDQDHLTSLMTRVIEDEPWRLGVRNAGPAHVQTGHTWAKVVDRLLEVLSTD